MKSMHIALIHLRRTFRKRTNIFFILLLPFVMILMLGLMFGDQQQFRLGVVSEEGPLADRLVDTVGNQASVEVVRMDTDEEMREAVERGEVDGGLGVPADYDEALEVGERVAIDYLAAADDIRGVDLAAQVRLAVSQEQAELRAGGHIAAEEGLALGEGMAEVDGTDAIGVEVEVETTGRAQIPEGIGSFYLSAPPLLLMFTFLTALGGAAGLVEARRRGISRRMYAMPVGAGAIVAGEVTGQLLIAFVQALIIMLGSTFLFGVNWGDPLGAAALLAVFSLVAGGAAMVVGSLLRSEDLAGSVTLLLGLGLAVLGGTAIPLDTFGETMRTLAMFSPHSWAYEGFAELVRHGGGIADITMELGVLGALAAVLLALGTWGMRRTFLR